MRLDLRHAWTIAARELDEARRDRGTVAIGAFFTLAMPILLVVSSIRPAADAVASRGTPSARHTLELLIPVFMMQVGFLPLFIGVNVIATAFAGERENGTLGPLIATPVSTEAIFVGKLIGAAIPAYLASLVGQGAFLLAIAAFTGTDTLRELPGKLTIVMVALVFLALFVLLGIELIVASRVASVRAAQQYGSLLGLPLLFGVMFWAYRIRDLGPALIALTIAGVAAAAGLALYVGARTWRREEAIARL